MKERGSVAYKCQSTNWVALNCTCTHAVQKVAHWTFNINARSAQCSTQIGIYGSRGFLRNDSITINYLSIDYLSYTHFYKHILHILFGRVSSNTGSGLQKRLNSNRGVYVGVFCVFVCIFPSETKTVSKNPNSSKLSDIGI
jgi:hypothetical protein